MPRHASNPDVSCKFWIGEEEEAQTIMVTVALAGILHI